MLRSLCTAGEGGAEVRPHFATKPKAEARGVRSAALAAAVKEFPLPTVLKDLYQDRHEEYYLGDVTFFQADYVGRQLRTSMAPPAVAVDRTTKRVWTFEHDRMVGTNQDGIVAHRVPFKGFLDMYRK